MVLPWPKLVAKPAALIVATAVLEDAQVAEFVMFCMLPSVKVPVAVNCWVCPLAIKRLAGVTENNTSAGGMTDSSVVPLMDPEAALIVVLPTATPVTRPPVEIVATDVVFEFHVTKLVRFRVLPSLSVPMAVNCCD